MHMWKITAAAMLAVLLAGCAAAASTVRHHQHQAAAVSHPAEPTAPASCSAMVINWDQTQRQWYNAVIADAQLLVADVNDSSIPAATIRADGGQLETDATTAQSHPPPSCSGGAREYLKAMGALALAGRDVASGDYGASRAFRDGLVMVERAMTDVNVVLG
jgi:type 1 fimbria pilin